MANTFLGEVTARATGKTYTLRCDFNAMCDFEEATGKQAMATIEAFEREGVSTADMRAMMWAFMRRHHPDATLQDAGDLLSENVGALMQVIVAAMPTPAEVAKAGKPRVRKPKPV